MDTLKTLITLALILGPPMTFGFLGKPKEMGISVLAGAVAAAFLNIDKFKRFKGAGFEAEMKEVVDKADATVNSLRELVKPLILATIDILTSAGRWGGMETPQKHKLMADLEKTAHSISLKDRELEDARDKFFQFHTWDHFDYFIRKASAAKNIDNEIKKKLFEKVKYHSSDFPTKGEILAILGSCANILPEDATEALSDYLYYIKNRKLRRPEALSRE